MLKKITMENFDAEIMASRGLKLLACIRRGNGYAAQLEVIHALSKRNDLPVEIYLADQESIRMFGERFGSRGDPFFILFENGCAKGRLLGSADQGIMRTFLLRELATIKG